MRVGVSACSNAVLPWEYAYHLLGGCRPNDVDCALRTRISGEHQPATVEAVFQALRNEIHSGVLIPGQRLIESDLMNRFNTNRSRIREIFRRLQADGLLTIDPNRGASVRRISRKEMADTIEVLEALSQLIVRRAIERRNEPNVRKMLAAMHTQAKSFRAKLRSTEQSRRFMDQNAWLWNAFDSIAANPVLSETRMRLETNLFRLELSNLTTSDQERWIAGHEDVIAAVQAGDPRRASEAVTRSVAKVLEAIMALPNDAFAW